MSWRLGWRVWIIGGLGLAGLAVSGVLLLRGSSSPPAEAPESAAVLSAQSALPFQVLIPGYLPYGFKRSEVQLDTRQPGPAGEPMIQISYPGRGGNRLVFREWLPQNAAPETGSPIQPRVIGCHCHCRSRTQCEFTELEIAVGALHILVKTAVPGLVTAQQMQSVLHTLGPAANRQIYTSMKAIPAAVSLPAAVEIPIDARGVQAVTLVVTPQGYQPAHFAVRRGIPVKVTFRQLGGVGCGDELIFSWGIGKRADLKLASADDSQAVEFVPDQVGDFPFHCPHLIFNGAMSVRE
jgi:hypothetical protein